MYIFKTYDTLHFYALTEDALKSNINPLLDYLFDRPKWYQLRERYILYKYKRFLRYKYTPSYEFLCGIYDFICTCENVYMWPNDTDSPMYAFRGLKSGIRSFKMTMVNRFDKHANRYNNSSDALYDIEYTLYPKGQINLAISRGWGNLVKTNISFTAGEPMNLSVGDQILFNDIINETMNRIVSMFEEIYFMTKHVKLKKASNVDVFSHGR